MEEKERYEFGQRTLFYSGEELTTFDGFNLDDFMQIICSLLNKQSNRIKDLELLLNADKKIETNSLNGFEKLRQENQQLKQKLKESESKRKSLEEKVKWLSEENEECFVDGQKYNELREQKDKEIAKLKQSQKQLAISKLEEVYEVVKYYNSEANKYEPYIDTLDIEQYIDDKIKELGGGENE